MAPQRKGTVPEALAGKLAKLGKEVGVHLAAIEAVKPKRDALIVEALRAGGSYREIGKLVGLDASSVHAIGTAHGWPDETELAHRERMRTDAAYRYEQLYGPVEPLPDHLRPS